MATAKKCSVKPKQPTSKPNVPAVGIGPRGVKSKETDVAGDAAVILDEGTEVEIAGQLVTMRRLDVRAVFRLSRLIVRVFLTLDADTIKKIDTDEGRAYIIYAALTYAEEPTIEFFAWMFRMHETTFGALPGEAVLDAVEALAHQEDISAFFGRASNLAKKAMKKPMTVPA